ncbi:MAG: hypothetical protein O7E54_10570 [Planctomycetota bacterium]|nr:hypothetical protein [Planctomycetota bacterium]
MSKKAAKKPAPTPAPTPATDEDLAEALVPAPVAPAEVGPHRPAAPRGLEEVETEDMVIPRFSIVQPSSDEGTAGHFRDNISGDEYEDLVGVVPLRFRKGRVYFLKPDDGGGLACASDDRITPAERIEKPVQDKCAGCPKAQWATGEGGKRIKPDCSETWSLLMAHEGVPYFITFKSAAMKATKRLLTLLKLQAQKQRVDLCGFEFDIRLELHKFDTGKAYLPVFEKVRRVAASEYANYQSIYDAFAHAQPVVEDEEPGKPTAVGFDFGDNADDDE